ncbi:AAA family ATPase [Aureibaculum luteum]|uniref:AAA family ATPase n=1 Tax=Aureibaculum luteum TaxID=1548456 RepID=UPI0018E57FA5|nr:DUF3696 domain-containing protein [Aureibaculum luteum]
MISRIKSINFKALKETEFECSYLNLFSGINGMGKSTALQILLLLRQSYKNGYLQKHGLALKGRYVNIGVGKDALYQFAEEEKIIFEIDLKKKGSYIWNFMYDSDSDILPFKKENDKNKVDFENTSLFNGNFQYLSAERLVPKKFYDRSDFEVVQSKNIGMRGEYVAHYLSHYGKDIVAPIMCKEDSRSNTLLHQVWAWMSDISPGIKINVEELKSIDAISLGYQYETNSGFTNEIKPQNVGFGLSYVLPVVVSILSAKSGDIILIENPESHLHPKGQSIIGKLMLLAAKNGVQLFVETHSDHVLNGIRVSISEGISPDLVKLFFFERNQDANSNDHYSTVTKPVIDANGRIDFLPKGFFDEWDNNLMKLL